MTARPIRIGTRGSVLARRQAETIAGLLRVAHPDRPVELVELNTTGDRDRATSLARIGGTGVFTREIESALLEGRVDIAVHSMKDLPTAETPGLAFGAVPPREDVRDAVVSRTGGPLSALPTGARIGTGSARRAAQLRAVRPDLRVLDIRGNVDTRLRRVVEGAYDAVILATAGLARLGLLDRASEVLPAETMLPAPGQGALAVQVRADDTATRALVSVIDHPPARIAVLAERTILAALGGGCLLPVAALARADETKLELWAAVVHPSGAPALRESAAGSPGDADMLATDVARRLTAAGAQDILRAMEAAQ